MIGTDPASARARPDLVFLRHRGRPPAAAQPAGAAGRSAPAVAEVTANLLDLSAAEPVRPDPRPAPISDRTAAGAGAEPLGPSRPAPAHRLSYRPRRVTAGTPAVLSPKHPAVTLTRLQSGIGTLSVEAACSNTVGDLRLGAAYVLSDGHSSLVQYITGHTAAPAGSTRPVIVAGHARYEQLLIDLRQVPSLDRLLIYGYSQGGGMVSWGGTLLATTPTGVRVELPLDRPAARGVLVLASIYNAAGELTIRAEMELFAGPTRDAVTAYGFDRIGWLDPATPLS